MGITDRSLPDLKNTKENVSVSSVECSTEASEERIRHVYRPQYLWLNREFSPQLHLVAAIIDFGEHDCECNVLVCQWDDEFSRDGIVGLRRGRPSSGFQGVQGFGPHWRRERTGREPGRGWGHTGFVLSPTVEDEFNRAYLRTHGCFGRGVSALWGDARTYPEWSGLIKSG
jgi:hypothetical protein